MGKIRKHRYELLLVFERLKTVSKLKLLNALKKIGYDISKTTFYKYAQYYKSADRKANELIREILRKVDLEEG